MNPIIDSIVVTPATVAPGGSFVVTVSAHDPDESTGVLTGSVRDAAGNETQASAVIHISDPLTYNLTAPAGFSVTPRAGQPGVFDCVAP
ncbi:MAG TPA: hypothetical protein VJS69_00475 [Candidatus Krumholzibacteria bacterium]|nr:hypothetical protein [Candidatus Krumholzibacteria bacterium]